LEEVGGGRELNGFLGGEKPPRGRFARPEVVGGEKRFGAKRPLRTNAWEKK